MKPKQFYFILTAVLAVLVLGGGAYYYLATQHIDQKTADLSKKLADVEVVAAQIDNLAQLSKQYQKIEPAFSRLDQVLPRSKQESEVVLQLDKLASINGMSLGGVNFPPSATLPSATTQTEKVGDALAVPVTIQLTGSYEQMQAFLQGLEKLNRFTNVTTLAINKGEKPKLVAFSLTVQVFLKP
ncbi:MAG TPA: type 4a pilus biogenesis protein PilO [Candidatus Nanoarchaeia archaeon]|nr:type 4a pilus biogenesis protein PilO [Candidatus Nanoarchaeia archaeon]